MKSTEKEFKGLPMVMKVSRLSSLHKKQLSPGNRWDLQLLQLKILVFALQPFSLNNFKV